MDHNQQEVTVSYISPVNFARFLLTKAPELLLGGTPGVEEGSQHLSDFWKNYQHAHPTHRLFLDDHPQRSMATTIPICFHGDEGRGKKKGNAAIVMFESCLGTGAFENVRQKRSHDQCDYCYLRAPCAKRFRTKEGYMDSTCRVHPTPLSAYQEHNTKKNSYLTKFVLCVLPNDWFKFGNALNMVIDRVCQDFHSLFEDGIKLGGKTFFFALTGLKGDLRWYEKIANLSRCFNKQIGHGLQMCHECEAGTAALPFEDASHFPSWGDTLFQNRPWTQPPTIASLPFEPAGGAPESILRRDLFHNSKVGLLRDFTGSALMLLINLGYFKDERRGMSNARAACLQRAHRCFFLYCLTTRSKAGLRSFTTTFFNAPKTSSYAWINCKGSDTTLIVGWLVVYVGGLLADPLKPEHVPTLQRIYSGAKCVKTWQHVLYSHGCWLPRHCAMVVYQELHEFLQHYNGLAYLCLSTWNCTGFAMKSKFHLLAHAKHDLGVLLDKPEVSWLLSPLVFSGEMNEDVIGRIARLSRKVDSRLNSKRTLELYLCKAKAVHRRFLKGFAEARDAVK